MSIYLSRGNLKLSPRILVWNLPHIITCPGAGECNVWCYEHKSRRFNAVQPRRQQNLNLSRQPNFIDAIVKLLRGRRRKRLIAAVRVHESGDFYDSKYLQKWYTIARNCPEICFYAYTKSFHLPLWDKKPSNFNIIQSYHSKWDHLIDPTKPTARVITSTDQLPTGTTLCPFTDHQINLCGEECNICITKSDVHVAFLKH